ncbi:hypothetical protein [Nannocystis bainbridge]|uniref:Lipoprotein n=1 Tax=Nannocystis bainbridge TaxID=2995303 RepID=A0ABT5E236_9BACT|nr:hypothetical protein [Nannocystis bainbridge]MDC0719935.1 hypothetical protein [Nannocystis bainbridge]
MKHAILILTSVVLGACDPEIEPGLEAEIVDVDASLPLAARPSDDFIALEWSLAAKIDAQLGRDAFVGIGEPPRPIEKFRLPEYEDETELVHCEDNGKASCFCFGVTSCKSARWASVCAPGTEDCGIVSCTCDWKPPQK